MNQVMFMRKINWLALILVAFAGVSGASAESNKGMVVTTDWLAERLLNAVVLDVGSAGDYAAGHIPGARLLQFDLLITDRDGIPNELPRIDVLESVFSNTGIGDRERIVLYSRDPLLAARAWFTLDYLGHGRRASILDGGYAKWVAEGWDVTSESTIAKPVPFHAVIDPSTLVRIAAMRRLIEWQGVFEDRFTIIDARGPDQFSAGHIPGAVNVPWRENFTPDNIPTLRPILELCDVYADAGVTWRTANTVYCRSGMQASMTYFVLEYLGYHAALYDGSFYEWSNAANTMIADSGREEELCFSTGRLTSIPLR